MKRILPLARNHILNEKMAITYLLDMLSANMLDDVDLNQYMEESKMLINPRDRYFKNKGIEEGKKEGKKESMSEIVRNMFDEGFSVEDIVRATGLSAKDVLDAK